MDNTESTFITNFETSVTRIGTLGVGYKPPNSIAALMAMQESLAQVLEARANFQQKESAEETVRNSREELYKTVAPLASELVDYCKALGLEANELANLQSFVREIRGRRAKPVPKTTPGAAAPKTISAAQTSYVSIAEHFANLVEGIRTITNFKPEEDKFKLATLDALVAALRQANTDVTSAEAATSTARQALDKLLYTGEACALNSVNAAKPYIRAVFGAENPVYQTITKLTFRKPSRLK
jgi:hypothetical protein